MGIALIVCLVVFWLHARELKRWSQQLERRFARHERFVQHFLTIYAQAAESCRADGLVRIELSFTGQPFARHERFVGVGHFDGDELPAVCLVSLLDRASVFNGQVVRTTSPTDDDKRHYYRIDLFKAGAATCIPTSVSVITDNRVLQVTADYSAVELLAERLNSIQTRLNPIQIGW